MKRKRRTQKQAISTLNERAGAEAVGFACAHAQAP